jgi:hypothetical protein
MEIVAVATLREALAAALSTARARDSVPEREPAPA